VHGSAGQEPARARADHPEVVVVRRPAVSLRHARARRGRRASFMLASVASAAVRGVGSYPVRVEANLSPGLPSLAVVGLPEGAVREGRERVTAALQNAGRALPLRRITVNLSPADVPKNGSGFDLPIALGLIACAEGPDAVRLDGWGF